MTEEGTLSRRRILTFMFALILALQLVFTAYSYTALKDFCTALSESTGEEVRALIQADIDKVMNQGVAFQQIHGFDEYAREVIEQTPLIERIDLTERGVDVVLDVEVSQEYIRQSIRKMLVDMLTVLVTSMFIAAEIVNYMIISINRKTERISGERVYDKLLAIRVSSFLIHVACYLPISFIPAMMNRLTGGAASDFILGLPVNIFFVTGFISTLLAGGWCLRLGWKRLLYLGVELLVLSSLMAGMIQHAAVLVLARGIYGAAYALIYVAIRDFAAATEDREERSKGLSQVTAGLYAGITIGAVVGSMIFDSIGFLGVFCVSAALGCVSFLIVKLYCLDESLPDASAPVLGKAAPAAVEAAAEEAVKTSAAVPASRIAVPGGRRFGTAADRSESSAADKRRLREEKRLERRQSRGVLLQVVKNRDMLRISLFVIVPLAVSALYFDYFLPVYSVKAGIASSDVGRAFLVNGLAVAYIAPLMVKYVSSRLSERINLVLFTVLMGLGFVSFGVLGGLAGILAAAAIMGVAEGTALVSQNMIMLDLPIAKEVGSSRMLSIYATIRKLAQTVGPQIFALFMLIGYRPGMAAFGLVIGICSVLFLASSRGRGKGEG